jgi:hypothetical protein
MIAHPDIPPFGKKRVTSMFDHDDSAGRAPAVTPHLPPHETAHDGQH